MPRDGAGVFTLVAGNPVVEGETIFADWANSTLDDIAQALTDSVSYTNLPGELEDIIGGINDLPVLSENNTWTGNNIFMQALTVEGALTANGTAEFNGTVTFNELVTFMAGMDVTGDATFDDIYCNNLYAIYGTSQVKSKDAHFAKIYLHEDNDTILVNPAELVVSIDNTAGTRTLTMAVPEVTNGDFLIITTGTGNVGNWVIDSVGRVKIPASATAIDDDRHLVSKGYVDAAIGGVPTTPATLVVKNSGRVAANGSITAGTGFTVSKTGTGAYTITLTAAASSAANMIPVASCIVTGPVRHWTAIPEVVSATEFKVKTGQGDSYQAQDSEFTFILMDAGAT